MRFSLCAFVLIAAAAINGCSGSSSAQNAVSVEEPLAGLTAFGLVRLNNSQQVFAGTNDAVWNADIDPWVTDGTAEGTFKLKDLGPGNAGGVDLTIDGAALTVLNGTAYFVAYEESTGTSLWSTDGTVEGTVSQALLVAPPLTFDVNTISAGGNVVYVGGLSYSGTEIIDRNLFAVTVD